jgi:hypothetical protein
VFVVNVFVGTFVRGRAIVFTVSVYWEWATQIALVGQRSGYLCRACHYSTRDRS